MIDTGIHHNDTNRELKTIYFDKFQVIRILLMISFSNFHKSLKAWSK